MQIRKSSLRGDCPECPFNPTHKIHSHGCYLRYGDCNDQKPLVVKIQRFLCVPCAHTISVLPDELLPYRPVPVPMVQNHFDALAQGTPPAALTEKEKGCLKRAWARFTGRVGALIAVLGQMIEGVKPSAAKLWNQLRQQSNLKETLLQLAVPFKTSLLADYLCLRPWVS